MSNSSSVKAITLTDLNTAIFAGAPLAINPNGLSHACFKIIINNDSNIDISISYDGAHAHDFVRAGAERILDFQTNSGPSGQVALMKQGTVVWAGTAAQGAGIGWVSLIGYYQD